MKSKKIRTTLWILIAVFIIAIGGLMIFLRITINNISQDPQLVNLTGDSTLKIAQIININKNTNDCWNQKNPYIPCTESNKLTEGVYTLHGTNDIFWLEGPDKNQSFVMKKPNYTQKITISYPDKDTLQAEIETKNTEGGTYSQSITLYEE